MLNMKRVVIAGTILVVAVGCNVFASSDSYGFGKMRFRKEKYFVAQESEKTSASGDKIRPIRGKKCKNLSEDEKAELKEKYENMTDEEKEALKENRKGSKEKKTELKEKFENMTDEEKEALKEKRKNSNGRKAEQKEKFENMTDEEKEALKENRKSFKVKKEKE